MPAGGGAALRAVGVDVASGVLAAEGRALLRPWLAAVGRGRPWVTLKTAGTLDGRVAAADGSSRWITSQAARRHAHALRAEVTRSSSAPGPCSRTTRRSPRATTDGDLAAHQPLRVVAGRPARARTARGCAVPAATSCRSRGTTLPPLLAELAAREVRHVLVEGGPTVAAAFLRAGVVDEVHAYLAPAFLGAGPVGGRRPRGGHRSTARCGCR